MPTQAIATTPDWDSDSCFTAGPAGSDILIQNISMDLICFALTDTAAVPAVDPGRAHMLLPKSSLPMQLKPDERIWFAAGTATVVVSS